MQERIRAILIAMLALLPAMAAGQDRPDPAVTSGRVTDARFTVIEGVIVTLRAIGVGEPIATVQTTRDGIFALATAPPGGYELRFEKPGFKTLTMDAAKAMAVGTIVMQIADVTEGPMWGSPRPPQIIPPRAIKKIEPEYTAEAKAAGLQGTAVVTLTVDENGLPRDVKFVGFRRRTDHIANPLGLDEAAIAATEKWRFKPSTRDGVPTPATVTIEVNFRLPARDAAPK
jgi:TonB family protein